MASRDPVVVLTKATMRASDLLGLRDAALAKVIGTSPATVSRYRHGTAEIDPDSKVGELALLLVRLFRSLDPLVGADGEKRKAWMRSQNNALGGVPATLIRSPAGLVQTLDYLENAMRHVAPITGEQDFIDALDGLDDKSEGAIADVLAAWNLGSARTERAREFARNVVRVLQAAVALGDDPATALHNIKNYPIRSFGSKTALEMVEEGRTDDVVAYLQSLSAGYVG